MTDPIREVLLSMAVRFRRAIERSHPASSSLETLRNFPRGACGDASLLLAKYLQVNRCGLSSLVLGKRRGQCHAWLQLQQYVIDITADQFADQDARVIVSSDSPWHASFNGNVHNPADFCAYDPRTAFQLTRAYRVITSRLFE